MSNKIQKFEGQGVQLRDLNELQRFVNMARESGFIRDLKGYAQACLKVQAGLELGLQPMQSLTNIHIVEGKPTLSANALSALMKRAGYKWKEIQHDEKICKLKIIDPDGEELGICSYSIEQAQRAGLTSRKNWQRYAEDMLFARCISRAARRFAPEVAMGIYETNELKDEQALSQQALQPQPNQTKKSPVTAELEVEASPFLSPCETQVLPAVRPLTDAEIISISGGHRA